MIKKKKYEPITLKCRECGKDFTISLEEQEYFHSMAYDLPKRCPDCRKARKKARKAAEKVEQERMARQEAVLRQKKWEEDEKALANLLDTLPYDKVSLEKIQFAHPEDSLAIIGNGFDLMHGVNSSYWDFQKTIGKNSALRYEMETYLDTGDLWSNLEDSLGRLNYSMFLNPEIIDMWLEDFGAYDPDAQAADFFCGVETTIAPTFDIPRELGARFKKWVKTLKVESSDRPFSMLHGNYKVLSFNYTEFIEDLYGAKAANVCYIHGCRKNRKKGKPDELILGHTPGMEEEQWDKVELKPIRYKDPYKQYIFESSLETAAREASWYDESTTKNCGEIIKNHNEFFEGLSMIKEVYVIGHSLSEVDYPYFEEVRRHCKAKWMIGYHSYEDMQRLVALVKHLGLKSVTIFRT